MEIVIRPARSDDIAQLVAIETDGHETLRRLGAVPDAPTDGSDDDLRRWLAQGIVLVAVDTSDQPLGFGSALIVGAGLHVCELDVAEAWQRRGIGRRLMQALVADAKRRELRQVTLTTDRFVPFNASFYQTLGFQILDPSETDGWLLAEIQHEAEAGLDPVRRCAMRLAL